MSAPTGAAFGSDTFVIQIGSDPMSHDVPLLAEHAIKLTTLIIPVCQRFFRVCD